MDAIKIVFIGGGNMAQALLGGLREKQSTWSLHAVDPSDHAREILRNNYGVFCSETIESAQNKLVDADAIVLAVKPQIMSEVIHSLREVIDARQLLISIAAGIPTQQLTQGLNEMQPVVRAMPNTPALINAGVSGLFANENVKNTQRSLAERVMLAGGDVVWLDDEYKMDAVTAISGSGPAYFFYLLESMLEAAKVLGLDDEIARTLVLQTGLGATQMAVQSEDSPDVLRNKVTSPGGTTEAALKRLAKGHFKATMVAAIMKAEQRGRELAEGVR